MKSNRTHSARAAALAALLLVAPGFPSAQEPHPPLQGEMPGKNDAQQEMLELFARVERNLKRIDLLLSDAAAGEIPVEVPEDSGLADLLRRTQEASQGCVNDMDRILELAQQQSQGSGQSSPSQQQPPPSPGDSPLDQPRDQTPQEQEQTPEAPDPQHQPQPSQQSESPPTDDGSDPRQETDNSANEPPDQTDAGPPAGVGPGGDRWGELPPRVREVFRSQGGGDLPVQYRDWIDSYYRRLNRQP